MILDDLERVLAWLNHADVQRYIFTQHEITLDEYQCWFECTLPDPKKHLLIFEVNHLPLGFVNFNEVGNGGIANWAFYVAPVAPKGTGRQLGCAGLYHAVSQLEFHKVSGQALEYNQR